MRQVLGLPILIAVTAMLLLAGSVVAEEDDVDTFGENVGKRLGNVSGILLVLTMSIVVWKPVLKYLRKKADKLAEDGKWLKKKLGKVNRWYMKIHYWIGFAAVVAGLIHGIAMNKWEILFWAGWVGMLLMSVTGGLLLWKWPPKKVRKGARLIHAQRALLVITVAFIFISHRGFN
ncbi:MAG TPA: hypothetical protein EYN58_02575 [Candidatus Poseidoniales archaeon]|nr:MAG: hypothetical protein CXX81_23100 [Euryarchaeota archaeon]HHZ74063.1 hypothetical protein [Candidatus Poseidoniales archaeon]PXY76405.1 MAG: hypothetical protein CXX81_15265 [Euryarchaeota archaeon]PXY78695.1 MAG: hypothetical protein CXX81_06430 [Euryarchaeota archaeon]HIA25718.1 hypothetical protein [Candidatus Poseidoniales archaeon]